MESTSLSSAVRTAESKNSLVRGSLQKELSSLDRERLQRMRELRAQSQQFREHLTHRSGSPSSRPNSAQPGGQPRRGSHVRVGSATPGRSADSSPSPARARQISPGSHNSPRAPRSAVARSNGTSPQRSPEARRKSTTPKPNGNTFVTQFGTNQLHRVEVKPNYEQPVLGVPQIVISEIGSEPRPGSARPGSGLNMARRGSLGGGGGGSPLGSPRGSDSGSEHSVSQSLNPPIRRQRSNSMPLVLPIIHSPPARRPSYCPEPDFNTAESLSVIESPRARSLSFSGIVPARRRGSICERWGSESERAKPRGAERRGSIGMEQMVRDLVYGVQHRELMAANGGGPGITDKQWKDLKKCRYLRFPSRENSDAEDNNED